MPRKKQRLQAIESELEVVIDHGIREKVLLSKSDEELFTIDNQGSKNARLRITKEIKEKEQLSKGEKKKLEKAVTKKTIQLKEIEKNLSKSKNAYDIWGNSDEKMNSRIPSSLSGKKRSIASLIKPGLSYNPAIDQHQEVLVQAVTLEQKKVDKEEKNKRLALNSLPIIPATVMNSRSVVLPTHDEFYNVNNDDDDDDSEEDDDDEDNENDDKTTKVKKQKSKLTTAERNRKRDNKQKLFKEAQEKKKKVLLKDLSDGVLPSLVKDIKKKENKNAELKQQKKKELLLLKQTQEQESLTKLTYDEAGQIPLSDELNGSLRQMIPKGNRVKDFVTWKVQTGEAMPKDRRKRRAYERPHGRQNVKWIQAVK